MEFKDIREKIFKQEIKVQLKKEHLKSIGSILHAEQKLTELLNLFQNKVHGELIRNEKNDGRRYQPNSESNPI